MAGRVAGGRVAGVVKVGGAGQEPFGGLIPHYGPGRPARPPGRGHRHVDPRPRDAAFFHALVNHSPDAVLIVDDGNVVRYANPSGLRLFGTEPLIGSSLPDLVHSADRARVLRALQQAHTGAFDGVGRYSRWRIVRSGRAVPVEVSCVDLRHEPAVVGFVVALRNATRQSRLEHELRRRASHDQLTGVANRASFMNQLQQAFTRPPRTGTVTAVLVADLDDFRAVNDTWGHEVGDQLLIAAARRLAAAATGSHGTVARLGGDEFAVLMAGIDSPSQVGPTVERVLTAFDTPFHLDRTTLPVAVSAGVAVTSDAADCTEVLRQAGLALRSAKAAGKAQWLPYQPLLHATTHDRQQTRAELGRAVTAGAFTLMYQPIVTLDSNDTVGFEALVRWRHPTRGLLPPAHFIDVAEESGLIVPLGYWVLENACATAARWQALSTRPMSVSVNVSARQLHDPRFVRKVHHELAESGLPPQLLVLEITESLLIHDQERVNMDLSRLRDSGVRIAIDDFGTGYSALSYLRLVPVDIIKIDRSFVHAAANAPRRLALLDCIVRLAHALDLQVIAEGIERPPESAALLDLGCHLGQGFLFGHPLNGHDLNQLLRVRDPGNARPPTGEPGRARCDAAATRRCAPCDGGNEATPCGSARRAFLHQIGPGNRLGRT